MFGPEASRGASIAIILVSSQAIRKSWHCTPSEFALLLDAALRQCPFNELDGLRWFVVVATGKDYGRDARPHPGRPQVLASDRVGADAIKHRSRRAPFRMKLFTI
jgi:hypothetical protein